MTEETKDIESAENDPLTFYYGVMIPESLHREITLADEWEIVHLPDGKTTNRKRWEGILLPNGKTAKEQKDEFRAADTYENSHTHITVSQTEGNQSNTKKEGDDAQGSLAQVETVTSRRVRLNKPKED